MKTTSVIQDQPLISVIMPVYNAERYVADAIRSILEQTYSHFEFIIVDDGSTDGTVKIIHKCAGRDSRVRLVYLTHGNGPSAANAGIALAQGEFIARMDADDVALPERFSIQLARLSQFAPKNSHFQASIALKPLILQEWIFKMRCGADLPY